MKLINHIFFTVLLTILAFGMVVYSACNRDPCISVSCHNGGVCNHGICSCTTAYQGHYCDTLIINNFIGTWSGNNACDSSNYASVLLISRLSDNTVILKDTASFGNMAITVPVRNTNVLYINDTISSNQIINGTMSFTGNSMQFQYTYILNTDTNHCSGNYLKM